MSTYYSTQIVVLLVSLAIMNVPYAIFFILKGTRSEILRLCV